MARMKAAAQTTCPVCGGEELDDLGPAAFQQPHQVAGVEIDLGDVNPHLFCCLNCTYWFFAPRIPADRLLACYSKSKADNWTTDFKMATRRNYSRKADLLLGHSAGKRILDYGCFDGGFLEFLGPSWLRYGIEPSAKAAAVAKSRGVLMIASPAEERTEEKRDRFHAIVLLDVIEHVNEPVALLNQLRAMLLPGGIILLETGDTDSKLFQRHKRRYWYCKYVDHVGFMNRRSLSLAAKNSGLSLKHFERSTHTTWSQWCHLKFDCLNLAFQSLVRMQNSGVGLPRKLDLIARGGLPRPCRKPDHFLAILERV
jgi:2-polyprenyl-3-methyl-5-hydroxy-6-metoxy-1,4-benzoquinol methylase